MINPSEAVIPFLMVTFHFDRLGKSPLMEIRLRPASSSMFAGTGSTSMKGARSEIFTFSGSFLESPMLI